VNNEWKSGTNQEILAPPALYIEYRVRDLNGGAKSKEQGDGGERERETEREAKIRPGRRKAADPD